MRARRSETTLTEVNPIGRTDYTVVRNNSYQRNNFPIRERHNERKNEIYSNPDIVPERQHLNVHFKQCEGSYTRAFDRLVSDGVISTRGLKADADVFCEFVFDVNTSYFEEHGGYAFAKDFFEEAYRMAIKEAGDERYILSAVMHADERNKGLSESAGHDVFHYHLHVVYIPVVEKEIRWSKRCKDERLRGTVREVIHQVSRSKKWAFVEAKDKDGTPIQNKSGRPVRIPSYSLLQDRFFEHMREAGFDGFERGARGSTTEHLSTLDYKIQEDTGKLQQIERQVSAQQKRLDSISENLAVERQINKTFHEIEDAGKRTLFGKVELSENDYKDVIELAKEGIRSRSTIDELKRKLRDAKRKIESLNLAYDRLFAQTKEFSQAVKLAPQRVKELFNDIFEKAHQDKEARQKQFQVGKRTPKREEAER